NTWLRPLSYLAEKPVEMSNVLDATPRFALDTNVALYLLGGRMAAPLPTGSHGVSVITEMEECVSILGSDPFHTLPFGHIGVFLFMLAIAIFQIFSFKKRRWL